MPIGCRDECGRVMQDEDAAMQAGWSYLSISARWRCGRCEGALFAVRGMQGQGEPTPDTLPPTSRGAIKKETASGIMAPSVKGNPS